MFMGGGGKQDGGGIDLFIFLFPEQNTALGGSRTPCVKDMKLLLSKNGGHSVNKSLHDWRAIICILKHLVCICHSLTSLCLLYNHIHHTLNYLLPILHLHSSPTHSFFLLFHYTHHPHTTSFLPLIHSHIIFCSSALLLQCHNTLSPDLSFFPFSVSLS